MKKLIVSLAVAAALVTSPAAMAAAPAKAKPAIMTTTGQVVSVNAKNCTVALSNMGVYVFGKPCKLSKVHTGEWVSITWWKKGNLREATKIVESKAMTAGQMMKALMPAKMH